MWTSLVRIVGFNSRTLSSNLLRATDNMTQYMRTNENDVALTAANFLKNGHIVAVPTDTVYGLAASAQCVSAVQKLYEIKKRNKTNPIAISVADVKEVKLWGDTTKLPKGLLKALLPGKVTIVLNRTSELNPHLNPNTNLVGIRIPKNNFVVEVANLLKMPLALTSANISNEPSPLHPTEFTHLFPMLAAVFDGGQLGNVRLGSTIIDLSVPGHFKVLRKGSDFQKTVKTLMKFNLHTL